jgi:hypothetical protein
MAAILEIAEVRQRVSPLSVADYHLLGEFNEGDRRTGDSLGPARPPLYRFLILLFLRGE